MPSGMKLDKINPGQWFGKQFADMVGAEKTQVWKSGFTAGRPRPTATTSG